MRQFQYNGNMDFRKAVSEMTLESGVYQLHMISRKTISPIIIGLFLISLMSVLFQGCAGTEGPTLKEQVNQALEHFYRGEELVRKREFAAAKEEYLQSIEISPRPRAYYHLALVCRALGQNEEAIHNLDKALELSPNFTMAARAKQQIQASDLPGSPPSEQSVSLPPEEEKTDAVISETIKPLPLEEETDESALESTVKIEPQESDTAQISDHTAEETSQETSISNFDAEAKATLQEINQAESVQDWNRVQTLCKQILQQYPENGDILNRLGFAQYQSGEIAAAEKNFLKAIEANPSNANAYNNLGVVLENLGRSGDAAKAYEKAIEISDYADACFNLAVLREKEKDYKAAISLYEKYLEKDSTSLYAEHARQRIKNLRRIEY